MVIGIGDIWTYVVNLRRRPDRRQRMNRILPRDLAATYTSDWDGPFDGLSINRAVLDNHGVDLFPWKIDSTNPWWSRPLKLGEIGCTLSHLACWRDAQGRNLEFAVLLEDDVCLTESFTERLLGGLGTVAATQPEIGIIYLGRFPLEADSPGDLPGFVIPGYSHCTFGYAASGAAIETLLAARLDRALVPIDEFLPACYIDHPRADLRQRFPQRVRALAFEPPLVSQLPKSVAGSDTEDSGFVDW